MRSFRRFAALACVSGAVLVGAALPAQSGTPAAHPDTVVADPPGWYQFGAYYTQDACRYFGDSLVAAGAWRHYTCRWEWKEGEREPYWYLYMYN